MLERETSRREAEEPVGFWAVGDEVGIIKRSGNYVNVQIGYVKMDRARVAHYMDGDRTWAQTQ